MITILLLSLLIITGTTGYLGYQLWCLDQRTENLLTREVVLSRAWPKVSIIVPIHNEQQHLQQAMTSLLFLNYPNYDIIAVNDRSTDDSYTILTTLANQHARLTVLTIKALPPGWLGKTYALQTGLAYAQGQYILFTDADVIVAPTLLTRAMDYMLAEHLDHLTLAPHLDLPNPSMKMLMPFQLYLMVAATRPWRIVNDGAHDALGIGAFNCVNRKALDRIGGMTSLALNPIDDIGLARRLKTLAIRQGYARPKHLLRLSWYETIPAFVSGFEKNIFAFFNYRLTDATLALLAFLTVIVLPFVGLLVSNPLVRVISVGAIGLSLLNVMTICHQLTVPKRYAWFYPVAALIILYTGLWAVGACLIRRGIYWGGLFFPLADLKAFSQRHK